MSRNFFPVVMAIGVGVFTGYYTFQPTLQQMSVEKTQKSMETPIASSASSRQSALSDIATSSPRDAGKSGK
ncbi:hypothetical protein N7539_001088 [Penicillium diatomitis]|uniref:Uncharacterized protein n=1 Tax=Penicillium diatomitis TaxID=2819901 RepID=A0A9W9XN13_9EURO|nr:uncharacterized protein N7539_001088 [Penicillium diatomitis]KAJ5495972.1 hypothetical protein N7539_001088 [Penicillium diatomitis]